jgi:hypothetical protein
MQNEATIGADDAALKSIANKTFCTDAMQNSNTIARYNLQTLCIL